MPETAPNNAASNPETSLILRKNPSHNVLAHLERAKHSLAELATVYLVTEAAGHSQATLDAKRRVVYANSADNSMVPKTG